MRNVTEMSTSLIGREPNYQAPNKHTSIPENAVIAVNQLFMQLRAIFPAWRQAFSDEKSYNETKRVWLETLVNAGITSFEQLILGIEKAKQSESPFFPSVGQFITWCQEAKLTAQGLPNEEELIKRVKQYACYHGADNEHEFKFKSDLEYDLVYWLYCQNQMHQWSVDEMQKRARKLLKGTAEKLAQGTYQPRKRKALPAKASFVDPALQKSINLAGVKSCKAILRGQA